MNKKIRYRVFASLISVISIILLISWIGINFYIEGYYYGKKVESMVAVTEEIKEVFEENQSAPEIVRNIESIGYQFGGKISIIDDFSVLSFYDKNIIYNKGNVIKAIQHKEHTAYVFESGTTPEIGQWLVYGAEIGNGRIAMLEIPTESIDETLGIIARFFNYLVMFSFGIASVFGYFLAKNISKPITELNNIAIKMSELEFSIKYKGNRKDEIGQLGSTLNKLTIKLEKTIADLTHELEKEKQLDVLRKSFIAQVSHELQTPLSVIKGYIEALEDGIVEEEEKAYYYTVIEEEAGKTSKMIKELLDLSQLEAGTFKMENEMVNISNQLNQMAEKYRNIAVGKGIKWQYQGLSEDLILEIDCGRFEQAIGNILTNAFKHVREDGEIRFYVMKYENELRITIENDGEKIEESQLKRIWESFYKAKTSDKKQGTGLGLAIAANIFKYYKMDYRGYNHERGVGFEVSMKIPPFI